MSILTEKVRERYVYEDPLVQRFAKHSPNERVPRQLMIFRQLDTYVDRELTFGGIRVRIGIKLVLSRGEP